MDSKSELIPQEIVEKRIFLIRSQKVMIDKDLAELYGIETKYLTRQVRRNVKRFPEDFMFRLTHEEFLRCQIVTSNRGGRRYLPYAFTEQGVAMLSTVLNSERAIQVNIAIMRAFVKLRRILVTHKKLARGLDMLEAVTGRHDKAIRDIFEVIRRLMAEPEEEPKPKIGFHRP
ncbi:MAG: ORF6N domain-containing protein [Planctomycetes bacterium]|nr:ORF6N domain-containing protein [Planctomycetota bacterium]